MTMKTSENLRNLAKPVEDKTFSSKKREKKNKNWN